MIILSKELEKVFRKWAVAVDWKVMKSIFITIYVGSASFLKLIGYSLYYGLRGHHTEKRK